MDSGIDVTSPELEFGPDELRAQIHFDPDHFVSDLPFASDISDTAPYGLKILRPRPHRQRNYVYVTAHPFRSR